VTTPGRPTVVFDLGGVLVDWDPRYLYRQLMPAHEVDDFLDEVGFAAWNREQDAGSGWAEAVRRHGERYPHRRELLAAYPARFPETLGGDIPGSVALLTELHGGGVRLLALTNWSAETFPHARARFGWLDLFEDVVVSGVEGMAKPDPAIFRLLLDRHGLSAADTVFVDDSPANIHAAADLGLTALLFRTAEELRSDLVRLGVLGSAPAEDGPRRP
jgi:2-haloacid dehalogenase